MHTVWEELIVINIKMEKIKDAHQILQVWFSSSFPIGSYAYSHGLEVLIDDKKIKNKDVFIIRIEQLYPFPVKTLAKELKRFRKKSRFFWCQEEPKNMGAWNTVKNYIQRSLEYIEATNKEVNYIGRNPAASPASGYLKKHLAEQNEILEKVVGKFN